MLTRCKKHDNHLKGCAMELKMSNFMLQSADVCKLCENVRTLTTLSCSNKRGRESELRSVEIVGLRMSVPVAGRGSPSAVSSESRAVKHVAERRRNGLHLHRPTTPTRWACPSRPTR